MIFIRNFLLLCAVALAGCSDPAGTGYFDNGAGLNLYTPETSRATTDLRNYYGELCKQAHPTTSGTVSCDSPNLLVRAGFNDIDRRCDAYLAWIDRKRIEASTFKSGVTAVNTLATGIGTIGADAVRNIAQVLGFATSIYDAYNNALLTGLESSVIKKLVYGRRRAYRTEFSKIQYTNYADATYALRGYLRICTPQTIVLSANDYAIAGLSGVKGPSPEKIAQQERAALQALSPDMPATTARKRPPKPDCPACAQFFTEPYANSRRPQNLRDAQIWLCVPKVADSPTPEAMAALRLFDERMGIAKEDGRISNASEFSTLQAEGCQAGDRDTFGYRNYYERKHLSKPADVARVAKRLETFLGKPAGSIGTEAALKDGTDFRQALSEARAELGDGLGDPAGLEPGQYTPRLAVAIVQPRP